MLIINSYAVRLIIQGLTGLNMLNSVGFSIRSLFPFHIFQIVFFTT
ncbi:hypothetical protein MSKU9_0170 [Komagataeibacter diospyri]|uniref:Uncharacterized protein n=1 Tax=Komagataeibacter diospyri TaxID=1932662 RepID=A0A4P5NKL4_9PROT|nr:hypothetical protein MSKU9_0170 [Komagataeibacter diospyri]